MGFVALPFTLVAAAWVHRALLLSWVVACMQARITAENPSEGFRPTSGRVDSLDFSPPEKVWGYFAVGTHGALHGHADSQFGHIFAAGDNRNEARKRLIWGLQQLQIRGDIRTPIEFLKRLLQQPAFVNHTLNTEWLDSIIKAKQLLPAPNKAEVVFASAAFRAIQALEVRRPTPPAPVAVAAALVADGAAVAGPFSACSCRYAAEDEAPFPLLLLSASG